MTTVSLREVVSVHGGGTPRKSIPAYFGGGIPWVTPKDMKRPIIESSTVTLTTDGVKNSPAKLVPEGSVLIVVRSGVLKHTLPVALAACSVTVNQDMKALVPSDGVDSAYLARLLKFLQPRILSWVRATTADNFSIDKLLDLEVELPPLREQRRIAAILDHADALRTKRRQILANLDALSQSVFRGTFGAPQTWVARWPMGTIGDLAHAVDYGTSGKAGDTGEWPILRMGNVTDQGRLDLTDLKYIDLSPSEVPKYTVRPGDMLFNRTNSIEKVGKSAVVRTDQPLALAGYLVRVRFENAATAEYVSAYLADAHGSAVRRSLAKAAVNQANINASEMRRIQIALPPLEVRQEFAERLAAVETQRANVQRALAASDELFASLQYRAFCGEL